MGSLPSNQASIAFTVSWGGSDDGSGVKDYTVQVKVDDGAWQTWLNDTASTSATYVGDFEHVYSFRVQARDQAHNVSGWSATDTIEVLHIPTLTPEPTYTAGTANTIHYTGDSVLYYYQVRRASNAACTSNVVDSPWVTASSYAFDSLSHGVQYDNDGPPARATCW
jgi:hypothetical protein